MEKRERNIFFAGSFNPFTAGHADIVERLLAIADKVTVGIGVNPDKPGSRPDAMENAASIREWVSAQGLEGRVEVCVYDGLTAEEARRRGAACLARGVRNATDFDYENSLAAINREAFGMDTILFPASPGTAYVSSTMVRELQRYGKESAAARYLPH